MARKKSEQPKMPAVADEIKTKPVRLDLSPEIHQMLRVVAAEEGKPMAVFAREVVENVVRERYKDRGRR
jgi:hypothetical protein